MPSKEVRERHSKQRQTHLRSWRPETGKRQDVVGYGLTGGHVILLNAKDSEYYEATKNQALQALKEWPGGLQVGGGITPENAKEFLDAGASHVVVTSYLFEEKEISFSRLQKS